MITATVSGSFHRHMADIYKAVHELNSLRVQVLSPSDPRVVDQDGDFLFVASDVLRSKKLVQDRHFAAIKASDFLWLVCPDGYVGVSAAMEIDRAVQNGVPIYTTSRVLDDTACMYVTQVASLRAAVGHALDRRRPKVMGSVLINPSEAIESLHAGLDNLRPALLGQVGDRRHDADDAFEQAKAMVAFALAS